MWKGSSRSLMFFAKFYASIAAFRWHFRIPATFTWLKPGLEVKFALEEAEKVGAKTYFLGPEFDQKTWASLYHETRITGIPYYMYKRFQYYGHMHYSYERYETSIRMANSEPSQFSEKCLDSHLINWYI